MRPRTVVDAGAHEGAHTASFVNWAEVVICFEPIPWLAAQLRNRFKSAVIHEVALSDSTGEASFAINRAIPSHSGLQIRKDADLKSVVEVRVQINRLDAYSLTDVDYIKIDCEGAELSALKGAETTIQRIVLCCPSNTDGPVIALTVGRKCTSWYEWAVSHGYTVADLFGFLLNNPQTYDQCVDRYYWDFFVIPNERLGDIGERLHTNGQEVLANLQQVFCLIMHWVHYEKLERNLATRANDPSYLRQNRSCPIIRRFVSFLRQSQVDQPTECEQHSRVAASQ